MRVQLFCSSTAVSFASIPFLFFIFCHSCILYCGWNTHTFEQRYTKSCYFTMQLAQSILMSASVELNTVSSLRWSTALIDVWHQLHLFSHFKSQSVTEYLWVTLLSSHLDIFTFCYLFSVLNELFPLSCFSEPVDHNARELWQTYLSKLIPPICIYEHICLHHVGLHKP